MIDTNKIIGVGDNGYIIKSNNGGASWKNIKSYTSNYLAGVTMASDRVGYAVGEYKTILKTEDQGDSWFPVAVNITGYQSGYTSFNDLHFFNKDSGIIVGDDGIIIITRNGGRNWDRVPFNTSDGILGVSFVNDSLGFICGAFRMCYKTTDGGLTWQQINIKAAGFSDRFTKVHFIDNNTGFIIGIGGLCLKTKDGGLTWTKINTPTSGEYYDMYFQNPQKGFIVGTYASGLILQTNDGGDSWEPVFNYPASNSSYYTIAADPHKKKIVIAGGGMFSEFRGHNGRNILSTTDSGSSYQILSRNGRMQYKALHFLNDSTGYMAGDEGSAFKTSDYGESWQPLAYIPSENFGKQVQNIQFLDALHGFASTDNIYKTRDGGLTWIKTNTPGGFAEFSPGQMYFFDSLTGLVQDNSRVFKTTDGGQSWVNVLTASATFYTDFAATADGKVFAVGYGGQLDMSTDRGSTWLPVSIGASSYLTGVYFYNNSVGYIGTGDNVLYKTIDGGKNWVSIPVSLYTQQARSFKFLNDTLGYMMCNNYGGNSWIYATKDGGLTWRLIREEGENVSRIAGVKKIYIVGGNGMILTTDTLALPGSVGYVAGSNKSCVNEPSTFAAGLMAGVNYNWVLSGGGTNKYAANMDTVLWNSAGLHTLSVSVSNACGTGPVSQVVTDVIKFEPGFTVQDSVLTASEGLSYQWLRGGYEIPTAEGSTNRSIVAKFSGNYSVMVKSAYGCTVTSAETYISVPVNTVLCPGGSASLGAYFFPATYQWQRNDGSGYVDISDNEFYAGTNTYLLKLKNIPSDWYGYQFRCVTSVGNSDTYVLRFANGWTGAQSDAWENPANWSCGTVPDKNTDVYISYSNVVINSNVTVRKLVVNLTSLLTVKPGNTVTITH